MNATEGVPYKSGMPPRAFLTGEKRVTAELGPVTIHQLVWVSDGFGLVW